MPDKQRNKSALDLYMRQMRMPYQSAPSSSTSVNVPDRRKYGNISFPQGMSKEEQSMLFALADSLKMNDYGVNIPINYYGGERLSDGSTETGGFTPRTNAIDVLLSGSALERANTLAHEMLHASAINVLPERIIKEYDSDANNRAGGVYDAYGLRDGSSEPLAYDFSKDTPQEMNLDTLYRQYMRTIQKNVKLSNDPLTGIIRAFTGLRKPSR